MAPTIEKISAVTFRVANMTESVRFYRDVLGMELLYGGEDTGFSSLRAKDAQSAILNLEQGDRGDSLGAADLLRHGCGRPVESSEGAGISSGSPAGCLLGRTVFPYARSGRPRAVVCPADLTVCQQLHELIRREEKLAEVFAQHCSAQGLSGMGFPE